MESRAFLGRLAHRAHLATFATATVKNPGGPVRLQAADPRATRHLQSFKHLPVVRIDPTEIALLAFPSAVPQLAVDPGNTRDETIRFDRAQDGAGFGVNLAYFAGTVLAHPERPLRPRQSRVALRRRRDAGDN